MLREKTPNIFEVSEFITSPQLVFLILELHTFDVFWLNRPRSSRIIKLLNSKPKMDVTVKNIFSISIWVIQFNIENAPMNKNGANGCLIKDLLLPFVLSWLISIATIVPSHTLLKSCNFNESIFPSPSCSLTPFRTSLNS